MDRHRLLLRAELIAEILGTAGAPRTALLRAPAGCGKTVALAQARDRLAGKRWRTYWLDCRFPRAAHALARRLADAGSGTHRCLGRRSAVFIDHLDAAEPELLRTIDALICAEAEAALFVASRRDPLTSSARLQLDGRLRVIDPWRLLLTRPEHAALWCGQLPPAEVDAAFEHSGGWLAACRHAHAAHACTDLLPRFVASEMFAGERAQRQRVLARLALLEPATLSAAQEILESDGRALASALAWLEPLVWIEPATDTVRFNPAFKRALLAGAHVPALRAARTIAARAAAHFERRRDVCRAAEFAVSAGNPAKVAALLARAGGILLLLDQGAERIHAVLKALPPDAGVRDAHLGLLRFALGLLMQTDTPAPAAPWRDETAAEPAAAAPHDDRLRLALRCAEALRLVQRAENALRFEWWDSIDPERVLGATAAHGDMRARGFLLAVQLYFLQRFGPRARAESAIAAITAVYRTQDFAHSAYWLDVYAARSALAGGDLGECERALARAGTARHGDAAPSPALVQLGSFLAASVAYQRGQYERALGLGVAAAAGGTPGILEGQLAAYVLPALCQFGLGDCEAALDHLAAARSLGQALGLPHLRAAAAAVELEISLEIDPCGRTRQQALYDELTEVWECAQCPFTVPWPALELVARARFLKESADPSAAARCAATAAQLLRLAQSAGFVLGEATAHLMLARLMSRARQAAAAKSHVAAAIRQTARGGALQTLLFASPDLARLVHQAADGLESAEKAWARSVSESLFCGSPASAGSSRLRFTARETAVLREFLAGSSYKLAARNLGIAPGTVKHYAKRVFAKLNVNSKKKISLQHWNRLREANLPQRRADFARDARLIPA